MKEKIKQILLKSFPGVQPDLPLPGQLDSIAMIHFIVCVENEFKITFYPHEMDIDCFQSIEIISELVEKKIHALA